VIIDRYIAREVTLTSLAVTAVLLLIVVSNRLGGYLTDAAEGALPGNVVFVLLGLKSVSYIGLLLPGAFYLGILLALGRLYRDSEMAALAACGVGYGRLYRAIALPGVPLLLLLGALALYAAPKAAELEFEVRERALQTLDLTVLTAGRFQESSDGQRVIYVERLAEGRRAVENVFVQLRQPGGLGIVASENAHQYTDPATGDRYIVLVDGYRYEGVPGQADFRVMRFEEHAVRMPETIVPDPSQRREARPTRQLWHSTAPTDRAELQWRLSVPISLLVLGLLAVPLARTNPRQGRYGKVLVGLSLYIIYANLLSVAQVWLQRGAMPPALGLWWVHVLFAAVALLLLWWQSGLARPRRRAA
jgi:lipopolysaccharide export system permease protein